MLVIFDLDDTLIETSECVTPYYLHRVFKVLQEAGATGKLTDLELLNRQVNSLQKAIQLFCAGHEQCLSVGMSVLREPIPSHLTVSLVPGAIELLDHLAKNHTLALVSRGNPDFQLRKMEKAGIQPERFSKLVLGDGPSKKSDYQKVLSELGFIACDTVVCGDRVSLDLTPAKELGMYTVHFRNGRGLVDKTPISDVDITIDRLLQLQGYVEGNESQSPSY